MKLIILSGASCSGKSTIIKSIMNQQEDLFHLSYDSLKWSFSNYNPDKNYKDVQKIVLSVAGAVFKMKYNIISDATLYKECREKLISLAISFGYQILEINLETSHEILMKRFDERVANFLAVSDRRISNISKDRFQELLEIFEKEKNPEALTFKTDKQNVEDITRDIIKLLK